jgi:hypothetical protein
MATFERMYGKSEYLECASHACALEPEAMLRDGEGRSAASPSESGSVAPALQRNIPDTRL